MNGPFTLNLTTTTNWLEFIHDRIGYFRKERETENREDDLDTSSGGGGAEGMSRVMIIIN